MDGFVKRPKVEKNLVATHRIWNRKDGRARVVESVSTYGVPTVWYAMQLEENTASTGIWSIASRHRKRGPAFKAAAKLNTGGTPRRKTRKARPKIKAADLARLSAVNSKRLPRLIEHDGVRKRWVGIGWVDEGQPDGTETLVV